MYPEFEFLVDKLGVAMALVKALNNPRVVNVMESGLGPFFTEDAPDCTLFLVCGCLFLTMTVP
jgi:hypothetical protein